MTNPRNQLFGSANNAILRLMLVELRVENYAVIDHVAVEFGPGLNLLTGETGAGKSILIDALALLMGDKASPEVIRHGAERAVVSCVFHLESRQIDRILDENGLENASGRWYLNAESPPRAAVGTITSPQLFPYWSN